MVEEEEAVVVISKAGGITIKSIDGPILAWEYTTTVSLTYGAAIKEVTASEKQQLNLAVNNAVCKIFGFRRWESIRDLREFYEFDSINQSPKGIKWSAVPLPCLPIVSEFVGFEFSL